MQLLCPHCGYFREIPEARSSAQSAVTVLCPACDQTFTVPPAAVAGETAAAGAPASAGESFIFPAELPKAGFWIRVAATVLDSLIISVVQGVVLFLFGAVLGLLIDGYDGESLLMIVLGGLLGSLIGLVYYVFFTGYGGQTPGKMALRIKVIRTDGSEIGLGRACYRETLCKFVSTIILGIGYLMVAFDEKKQGLHDRMADTYVVKL